MFGFGVNKIELTVTPEPTHSNSGCITLGWGTTSFNGEYPDTLQYVSKLYCDLKRAVCHSCGGIFDVRICTFDMKVQGLLTVFND